MKTHFTGLRLREEPQENGMRYSASLAFMVICPTAILPSRSTAHQRAIARDRGGDRISSVRSARCYARLSAYGTVQGRTDAMPAISMDPAIRADTRAAARPAGAADGVTVQQKKSPAGAGP
jgi:hypothetical protein